MIIDYDDDNDEDDGGDNGDVDDDDDDVCSKAQDEAKAAETKIVAEHDYTNILTYFRKVNTLRYV